MLGLGCEGNLFVCLGPGDTERDQQGGAYGGFIVDDAFTAEERQRICDAYDVYERDI